MICPDTDFDCDNPGCRRGGCQGRRPELPLLRIHNQPAQGRQTNPHCTVAAHSRPEAAALPVAAAA